MAKFSRPFLLLHYVVKLRRYVKIDTQRMRGKSLRALEEMFVMAKGLAKNKEVDLLIRQKWAQVAAYIAQVMNSVARGFDERGIDVQLDELERLVNEAKAKGKTKRSDGAASARAKDGSEGPS